MRLRKNKKLPVRVTITPVSVSVQLRNLAPIAAFEQLKKNSPSSFFLEKTPFGEKDAEYSFIGIHPYRTIRIQRESLTIQGGQIEETLTGNPLAQLTQYLSQFQVAHSRTLPPFCSSVVGYIGYDCAQYVEKLPQNKNDLNYDEACLIIFRDMVVFDHKKNCATVVSNMFSDEEEYEAGIAKANERAKKNLNKIRKAKISNQADADVVIDHHEKLQCDVLLGHDHFVNKVREIKEEIRKGEIFQCVLSERFHIPIKSDPLLIFGNLREISPSPYSYYLSMNDVYIVGASPEMLVRVDRRSMETSPIAGTRPRGENKEDDLRHERNLLKSVKEKAEHLMLVDLGRNDVGRVCSPGSVGVEDFMHVECFSHVMHLVSKVNGTLRRELSPFDAFFSTFPAGTLTGAPKIRSMEIISKMESVSRGTYGGAIILNDFSGLFDSCINIRSTFIKEGVAYVQAGAGIVADSNPSKEYEEVLNKSLSVRKAIAMAERCSL